MNKSAYDELKKIESAVDYFSKIGTRIKSSDRIPVHLQISHNKHLLWDQYPGTTKERYRILYIDSTGESCMHTLKEYLEFNIGVASSMIKGQIHVLKTSDKVCHEVTIDTLEEALSYLEASQELLNSKDIQ